MSKQVKTNWFKDAFIYQIYPRSFCDSNGDGIGDLKGIISKLDYLQELGVDAVWLSPIYKSPNHDNGYDISNYRDIMDEFGTLDDWKEMIDGMHKRGIRLVMDLVANHTSSDHVWFQESLKGPDNPYSDYYIWADGKGKNGKKPPNNWSSRFGGTAWEYDEGRKQWYLHLFVKQQPDLNWENPKVRQEIIDICNYWFDLGVDGFRCDVITYISKVPGLPDGKWNPVARGDEMFTHGPRIHEFLNEVNQKSWSLYDTMIVGEAAGVDVENAILYTDPARKEMDCVLQFEHFETCFWNHVVPLKFNLPKFKKALSRWQYGLQQRGWNALYLENHDQPRSVSLYTPGHGENRVYAAKMLATAIFMLQGTPFLYQGQEIGMTNYPLKKYSDCKDVVVDQARSVLKPFDKLFEGIAIKVLNKRARDHARTPMQWDDSLNAGFSTADPWYFVNPNYTEINVKAALKDPDSILNFYKKLIAFRKGNEIIINGTYQEYNSSHKDVYCYERSYNGEKLFVICNFKNKEVNYKIPAAIAFLSSELKLHNYGYDRPVLQDTVLRPYEALVYKLL